MEVPAACSLDLTGPQGNERCHRWLEQKLGEKLPADIWEVHVAVTPNQGGDTESACALHLSLTLSVSLSMLCDGQWAHDGRRLCKLCNTLKPGSVDMGKVSMCEESSAVCHM